MKKYLVVGIVVGLGSQGLLAAPLAPVVDYSVEARRPVAREPKIINVPTSEPQFNSAESFENWEPARPSVSPKSNLNLEQRVSVLENKVSTLAEQNLLKQLEALKQSDQQKTGQIEEQKHQLAQLQEQLNRFYQDLDHRLATAGFKPSAGSTKPPKAKVVKFADETLGGEAEIKDGGVVEEGTDYLEPPKSKNLPTEEAGPKAEVKAPQVKRSDEELFKEQQLYQTAIDLLPDKKYEVSRSKLRDYLAKYPKGGYVADAHYWLGEISFLQKNYDAAEEEFKIIIKKFPKARRVPNALFKLALVHQQQGRDGQAKTELKQVIKQYPSSSVAALAKVQLDGN